MQKITLLITDDHLLLRQSWCMVLDADPRFSVADTCGTAEEAIELAHKLRPDIVLMDINLPGMSGIDATEVLCQQVPSTKVVGLSLHNQPVYAQRMMRCGAWGYITKNAPQEELAQALVAVHEGKKYVCREIKDILAHQVMGQEPLGEQLKVLSAREHEVIDAIKKGWSSKEIAMALQITSNTVEVHRHRILQKLQLKNTAALVDFIHRRDRKGRAA